jgi:hypothetical protein
MGGGGPEPAVRPAATALAAGRRSPNAGCVGALRAVGTGAGVRTLLALAEEDFTAGS